VRIGVNTNPAASGGRVATIDEIIEQVRTARDLGLSTAAFAHIFAYDALTLIAVVARAVAEIELETAVVPIYVHHPFVLAQQALTTQAAAGGRLLLGIGLSHRPLVEQRWGLSFERPVEYMQEYLAILQPLLRGEPVDYAGQRLKTQGQLTIAGAAPPPVVLAALGERMLRLAGEQADGTALWMVGAKTLASHVVPIITDAARRAGRAAPRVLVGLPMCVTSDPSDARARAAQVYQLYGNLPSYRAMLDREGAAGPADVALVGSESEIERQLDALEEAGATDFTANIFGSEGERQRTLELLASRVAHGRGTPV
jgi:5,10-methylenetetrahydromethanopterin reductase